MSCSDGGEPTDFPGGTKTCIREVYGTLGSGVDSRRSERSHRPNMKVKTGSECRGAQGYGIPVKHTTVLDFGGGSRTTVPGQGGEVPRNYEKMDPLRGMCNRSFRVDGDRT